MNIKIINIATANPRLKLSQNESLRILRHKKKLSKKEDVLYRKFLLDKGILTRHFAVRNGKDFFVESQNRLISRFQKEAVRLSVASLTKCLKKSLVNKDALDCVIAATCTGYLCPGLTSYIIEEAGLDRDIFSADIVGMGCGGALPAVKTAYNFLQAHKNSNASVVATEICSSAIFWDDDPDLILSNSIFADGSASCVMTNKNNTRGFKIIDYISRILPEHRDKLRFRTEDSRLRNVISPLVPKIAGILTADIIKELLRRNELKESDVKYWAIHPGGRKVLDNIRDEVDLKSEDLAFSRDVLRRYGNMSSPTVLYVLNSISQAQQMEKHSYIIMASFGAGFSGYAALLVYE